MKKLIITGAVLALGLSLTGCASAAKAAKSAPALKTDTVLYNALPSSIREAGAIRVATDASYAPASSFGPDGHTIIGFEPDLGSALSQVLGVKVVFANRAFATLPALLKSGGTDLVMSAMTDTAERERTMDFVDYFTAGSSIVVQRGNPAGISDLASLCGHSVALEKGTVQVDLVQRAEANCATGRTIATSVYSSNTDALVQVRTGRADAALTDYPPAAALVANSQTSAFYQLSSTTQYEPGPYGIAVAKNQTQLRDAVAEALRRVIASGRYSAILDQWGVGAGAIDSVMINAGAKS